MHIIKVLMKSIREYKTSAFLTIFLVFIEVFLEVSIPFVAALAIDQGINNDLVINNQDLKPLLIYGAILIALTILCFILGVLAGFTSSKSACGFTKNLRIDLYNAVQDYSFTNIDKFSTPSIVTRIINDTWNIQNAYIMIIRVGIRGPIMLILALILSFINHWAIGLIYLIVSILLGTALIFIALKAHPLFEEGVISYDDLNGSIQENLAGIRVVKSFVKEEDETNKFKKVSYKIYNLFSKGGLIVAFNTPIAQISIYAIMLLLSFFVTRFILKGEMNVGQLSSSISYAWMILNVLLMITGMFVNILIAVTSAERIYEILVEKSDIVSPINPVKEVKNGSIEFKNVTFRYKATSEKPALDHINLKIESGETIGILGGTGSAKTSLVSLIARLYDASEGEVLVGETNVKDYDLTLLRDKVSVVLQKNVLFSGTISENLRWGKEDATEEELIHACKLAQADSFIENLPNKYEYKIEQGGTNVSGGQRQRLCIARALLKTPKIIILDDSTSAVDTKTDSLIRKGFKEFIPEVTKIIIAQRVSSVQDADKIIIMDEGKINDIGTHEELIKRNQIYQEIYESQNRNGGIANE